MEMIEATFGYDDVAQTWRGMAHGTIRTMKGTPRPRQSAIEVLRSGWQEATSDGFYGATLAEMTDRVDNGWQAEGMKLSPAAASQTRPRWRYTEEGELQVELALQGHDQPYLSRQSRKRQPGVRLAIAYNFRGGVTPETISAYAAWVADLVAGFQARGVDLEIDVFQVVLMECNRRRLMTRTNVRVKRFGRKSSLKTWGAMFSPSGYRMLGFASRIMTCAENGKTCDPGMGGSVAPGWGLDWAPKTRTLTVNVDHVAHAFPAELMTKQLSEIKF